MSRSSTSLSSDDMTLVYDAIGLAGEAGEVLDNIKKAVFHKHGVDKKRLKGEIGDCLWYISSLCSALGLNLHEVMQANINKLIERYPNGFTTEDSINRKENKNV